MSLTACKSDGETSEIFISNVFERKKAVVEEGDHLERILGNCSSQTHAGRVRLFR